MRNRLWCVVLLVCLAALQGFTGGVAEDTGSAAAKLESIGFNRTGLPITQQTTPLKVFYTIIPEQSVPMDKMPIIQEVEGITNVDVEWLNVQSTSRQQKVNLMFASGDLPDVFWDGLSVEEAHLYGSQGLLRPLSDLIDQYAPTIKKMIEEKDLKATITAPDGKVYTLFRFGNAYHQDMGNMLYINTDWLKQIGKPMPKTLDEYYQVLKTFKAQDMNGNGDPKDEIPLGYCFYRQNVNWSDLSFFGSFGLNMDQEVNFLTMRGKKVTWGPVSEEFKKTIQWLSKLYAEGLIDQEAYIHDKAQMKAKGTQQPPIYGSYVSWFAVNVGGANAAAYQIVGPLKGPDGKVVANVHPRALVNAGPGAITADCEIPEVAMRWLDYVYQPEVNVQLAYGKEGEAMKKHPDGRWEILPPPAGQTPELYRMMYSPHHPPMTFPQYLTTIDPPHFQDKDRAKRELFNPVYPTDQILPVFYLSSGDQEQVNAVLPDLMSLAEQKWASWVMNGGIEKEWDGYVKQINQMGLQSVLDIYQKGYDNLMANK